MKSTTASTIVRQLENLIAKNDTVSFFAMYFRGQYQVTVYPGPPEDGHSHYEGDTLAEAVNRAAKET